MAIVYTKSGGIGNKRSMKIMRVKFFRTTKLLHSRRQILIHNPKKEFPKNIYDIFINDLEIASNATKFNTQKLN